MAWRGATKWSMYIVIATIGLFPVLGLPLTPSKSAQSLCERKTGGSKPEWARRCICLQESIVRVYKQQQQQQSFNWDGTDLFLDSVKFDKIFTHTHTHIHTHTHTHTPIKYDNCITLLDQDDLLAVDTQQNSHTYVHAHTPITIW